MRSASDALLLVMGQPKAGSGGRGRTREEATRAHLTAIGQLQTHPLDVSGWWRWREVGEDIAGHPCKEQTGCGFDLKHRGSGTPRRQICCI